MYSVETNSKEVASSGRWQVVYPHLVSASLRHDGGERAREPCQRAQRRCRDGISERPVNRHPRPAASGVVHPDRAVLVHARHTLLVPARVQELRPWPRCFAAVNFDCGADAPSKVNDRALEGRGPAPSSQHEERARRGVPRELVDGPVADLCPVCLSRLSFAKTGLSRPASLEREEGHRPNIGLCLDLLDPPLAEKKAYLSVSWLVRGRMGRG